MPRRCSYRCCDCCSCLFRVNQVPPIKWAGRRGLFDSPPSLEGASCWARNFPGFYLTYTESQVEWTSQLLANLRQRYCVVWTLTFLFEFHWVARPQFCISSVWLHWCSRIEGSERKRRWSRGRAGQLRRRISRARHLIPSVRWWNPWSWHRIRRNPWSPCQSVSPSYPLVPKPGI